MTATFDYNVIDEYQLEITSYCNAACPQCPRNINGGDINPYMPLVHLPREVINRNFDTALCQRLRQIFFCGSYGDPGMHPDFLGILHDFRTKSPRLWLYVHTNGGMHNEDYWGQVGELLGPDGQIDFGIDGLEDTLHLYRKNVDYHKVMANVRAFIQAGGRAQWNFIVFQHNEHQVEQARALSQELGFVNFLARRTGRFFDHRNEVELDQWPVQDRAGQIVYWLKPPVDPQWRNRSLANLPDLKTEHPDLDQYFANTPIICDATENHKVAVSAQGLVMPCNFFTHNLYDARFHDGSLPGANSRHAGSQGNQVREFLERYGLDTLNLHYRSLPEIFDSPMWSDLVSSWTNQHRLFECAMTCGTRFTKVWDQGGNPRKPYKT